MKKVVSLVISLILVLACCMPVMAAGERASCSGNASVTVGQNITLTFSLSGYSEATSGGVTVSCGNEFEIVSGSWLKSGPLADFNIANKQGVVGFSGATNINGNLFQLVLKAKTASASAKNVSATFTMMNGAAKLPQTTATKSIQIGYATHVPKSPSSVKATLYGHDDVKVSWSKVSGASGYKVYYKKSTSNTWSAKSTTGTSIKLANLADGVKYDIKVVAYTTVSGNKCYSAGKSTSIYTLKKITGVKVAKSGSKVKVSWTNISGETGYQISKSTKKSGTSIVSTYKTTSGKSKTITAIKKKTYYYKVRAYKVVGGKKIYSPWSTAVKYRKL